jgi:ParB/RepB/Spo0J family partition protein
MPKLDSTGGIRKISLDQVIEKGNIREDYRDIEELAKSIKTSGLLQPIMVKSIGKNADGIDEYELIAGHRRKLAFQYLCENGDDFSRIDAVIVTGDKLTLQLIENLQRSDLTAREREHGIYLMTKDGKVPLTEVAELLGKNDKFVYRNINAYRIRALTDKAGIDTVELSTNTLCEIAAAADKDVPMLVKKIKEEGGTMAAARRIWREYRGNTEATQETPSPVPAARKSEEVDRSRNRTMDNDDTDDDYPDKPDVPSYGNEPDEDNEDKAPPNLQDPADYEAEEAVLDQSFHKMVDFHDVFVIIDDYTKTIETKYPDTSMSSRYIRLETVTDIIMLLRDRL